LDSLSAESGVAVWCGRVIIVLFEL